MHATTLHCIEWNKYKSYLLYHSICMAFQKRQKTNKQTNKQTNKKNTTTKHSSGTGDWGRELNAEEALGKAVYGNVLYVDYGGSCMT